MLNSSAGRDTGVAPQDIVYPEPGYDTKTYEHIKNWYDTQAWLPKNAVIVNKAAFDALDKPTQTALLKAGADAETRGWAMSKKSNTEVLEKLKANGMVIHQPSAQLKTDMKKVGDTMLKEWLEKAGPEGQQLVEAYRKQQPRPPAVVEAPLMRRFVFKKRGRHARRLRSGDGIQGTSGCVQRHLLRWLKLL